MTDHPPVAPPATRPKSYEPPVLKVLGEVGAVTAGPESGELDQLGGATGGFLVATGTS